MAPEYNQLIALFGSLDKDEQEAILQDLEKIVERSRPKPKPYLETMEGMMGYPITKKGNHREATYARAIVAYTMACDGYSEIAIAKVLHRDHSTVHHYKGLMRDALKFPMGFYDLIAIYKRYKDLMK